MKKFGSCVEFQSVFIIFTFEKKSTKGKKININIYKPSGLGLNSR